MNPIILKICDVSFLFGRRQALNNVSCSIEKGEIFGFLGPNGGGKTTLFRVISTLLCPQQGRVLFNGQDVQKFSMRVREKMGVVFQSPSLDIKLTVCENMKHQGHLYGLSGVLLKSRISELIGKFNLQDRLYENVEKLSGGLRRRVELAKILLHKPEILILDEPSVGLDPVVRKDFWNHLKRLRKEEGVTIVFTTHILEEAEECDHVAILDQGEIVACDSPLKLKHKISGDVVSVMAKNPKLFPVPPITLCF